MRIRAIIHLAVEGGYWAEVPALPGCISEGDTMEEVVANLKDAIEGWLDVANNRNAVESTDQVVEIAIRSLFLASNCLRLWSREVGFSKELLAAIISTKTLK